ncbi:MAG: hypothetical protein N2578_08830 [Bdellovibrionaceae bacterium]|nr:hypothetical protein [Pseudobdellovibrionaceae bacterium]
MSLDLARIALRGFKILCAGFLVISGSEATAKKKTEVRKVQEVSFEEMSLKGTIRNPDGAFLVQKRGLRFMPLYEVKKNIDHKIRESSLYVR